MVVGSRESEEEVSRNTRFSPTFQILRASKYLTSQGLWGSVIFEKLDCVTYPGSFSEK